MNELKKIRKELEITQLQAANACGVSLRTYQTYEETDNANATYNDLIQKLNQMGILDGSNYIVSVKTIKTICRNYFGIYYPEIISVFLLGEYARGKATGKSNIELLIVTYKEEVNSKLKQIEVKLTEELHKIVKVYSCEDFIEDVNAIKKILIESIKIYG